MTKVAHAFCWLSVLIETPEWDYKEWASLVWLKYEQKGEDLRRRGGWALVVSTETLQPKEFITIMALWLNPTDIHFSLLLNSNVMDDSSGLYDMK